jgi:UDP-galactopyranose mutase
MTILIVGAGLTGCVLAERFASIGKKVIILEKRDHIAGNCYDYIDENGILVNKYGVHIFHTNSEEVWEYINRFVSWKEWKHTVYGRYKDLYFPIPMNITSVNVLLNTNIQTAEEMKELLLQQQVKFPVIQNSEQLALSRFGKDIYEKVIYGYTKKQWEKEPRELDASVVGRIPIRYSYEEGYFNDTYQVLPEKGYTHFCEKLLEHQNIEVKLTSEYRPGPEKYEKIFYTGPIDMYFKDAGLAELEYRSLEFVFETVDKEYFQEGTTVNYTDEAVPYTRIIEYKHFFNQKSKKTTIVKEYPKAKGEPYYPVPTDINKALYEEYKKLAEEEEKKGIYFVGRLANYKYFNMDEAILNALNIFDLILKKEYYS